MIIESKREIKAICIKENSSLGIKKGDFALVKKQTFTEDGSFLLLVLPNGENISSPEEFWEIQRKKEK